MATKKTGAASSPAVHIPQSAVTGMNTITQTNPNASFGSAVKWSYVMDGGRQVLTTIVAFLLAALLGPETLGISAMALTYVLFIHMLQTQGLAAALIQKKDLRDEHLHTAFWALLALSCALTLVSIALAGWWAGVNNVPLLRPVIIALSAIVPLQGLVIVQEAVMKRALDFKSLALRTNVAVLASGVVAVALALAGAGVWAIVGQQIVSATVGLALLWRLGPYRPRRSFSRSVLRNLLGFSSLTFVATLAVFVGTRADAVIIGLFFGPMAAGIYFFANRLVSMVIELSSRGLQGVSLPELSRLQSDPERMTDRVVTILRASALVSFPVLALVGGASDEIVALLGDDEWATAGMALRLLVVIGAVRALTMFTGPLLLALGRPGQLAGLSWIVAALNTAGFAIAGRLTRDATFSDRMFWLITAQVFVYLIILVLYFAPLFRHLQLRVATLGSVLLAPVCTAAAGFGTLWLVGHALGDIAPFPKLVIEGIAGVLAIAMCLALIFRDDVDALVGSLRT